MTVIKMDFARSHQEVAKNATENQKGQSPSPRELSFIDNAYARMTDVAGPDGVVVVPCAGREKMKANGGLITAINRRPEAKNII